MIALRDTPFDPAAELDAFTRSAKGAGGIVSFLGCVRPSGPNGTVRALTLQSYHRMTQKGIERAVAEALKRWQLVGACVIHRVGVMKAEDPIVFVATAAAHRRDAFEAADFLMDYLKTCAIFWKKETTDRGEFWIEPRIDDYEDAHRWTTKGMTNVD